ncbi:IclR family transcriptional regulator [Fusibacter ferrireducens]|uniref:IclR family transcriptional regulator n=1 Tax=Fusibacter ferrireducens TaxID=2785058 RepID=A0ABR9ZZA7_9FIRM|nr:IclR family transcriptional regulator [Fusibacter ferrireducens]MBF4695795.1 IclR family transcriptional regulator [Fusibacter ferrireducens]
MPDKSVQNRSVDRTLDILEAFINVDGGLTLNEIALKIDLSSSTVYRLVMTLMNRNYLYRDSESKRFYLGSQLNRLVNLNHIDANEHLKNIADPYMMKVFQETNENIGLYIQDEDCKLCIERMESTKALRHVIDIGDRVTMSKGAIGKVFLAFMEPEEWKAFDKEGWPKKEELQKVKKSGYALSIGEREEGLIGIAAPILNSKGKVIAAVSMSGPSVRFMDEFINEKIDIVIKLAKDISKAMGLGK